MNVTEKVIEVHLAPRGGVYSRVTGHTAGDALRPEAFPDVAVKVTDVFA